MKYVVLISCFDWYESRLKPIKIALEEKEYKVIVLTSDYNHVEKKRINKRNYDCTYIPVKAYEKNISFSRLLSHYQFAKKVLNYLEKLSPDLVYALVPPNSVAKVCAKYKKKNPNVKLVFDIIDMWPESMPGKRFHGTPPFRYWQKLRDLSLREADHIFTECSLYQEKIEASIREKCSTLFLFKCDNGIGKTFTKQRNLTDIKKLRLCYLGSINHIIDVDSICHVVQLLMKECPIEVRVIGKGENQENFVNALKSTGAEVKFYGPIFDEKEKFKILGECDYALNMMIESVSVGLTIKSIDYFSYGLPIINNIKGDTWKLVSENAVGLNYNGNDQEFIQAFKKTSVKSPEEIYGLFRHLFSEEAFIDSFKRGLKNV